MLKDKEPEDLAPYSESGEQALIPYSQSDERAKQGKRRMFVTLTALVLAVSVGLAVYQYAFSNKTLNSENNKNKNQSFTNDEDENQQMKFEEARKRAIEKKPEGLRPALREYRLIAEDLDRILREELEEKNIGGVVTVTVTNWQFNQDQGLYKKPDDLGFQRIASEEALVNRAIKNEVKIDEIKLTPQPDRTFNVSIKATNLTAFPLVCTIPKGQVFEVKAEYLLSPASVSNDSKHSKYKQSTSSSGQGGEGGIVIPPRGTKNISLTAFCINRGLPSPNGPGNITIYELRDKTYKSQEALHTSMDRINSGNKIH